MIQLLYLTSKNHKINNKKIPRKFILEEETELISFFSFFANRKSVDLLWTSTLIGWLLFKLLFICFLGSITVLDFSREIDFFNYKIYN